MSEDQARDSMFSDKRKLDVLNPSPEAFELLVKLMGKDSQPKKDFVFNNIDFSEIKE